MGRVSVEDIFWERTSLGSGSVWTMAQLLARDLRCDTCLQNARRICFLHIHFARALQVLDLFWDLCGSLGKSQSDSFHYSCLWPSQRHPLMDIDHLFCFVAAVYTVNLPTNQICSQCKENPGDKRKKCVLTKWSVTGVASGFWPGEETLNKKFWPAGATMVKKALSLLRQLIHCLGKTNDGYGEAPSAFWPWHKKMFNFFCGFQQTTHWDLGAKHWRRSAIKPLILKSEAPWSNPGFGPEGGNQLRGL